MSATPETRRDDGKDVRKGRGDGALDRRHDAARWGSAGAASSSLVAHDVMGTAPPVATSIFLASARLMRGAGPQRRDTCDCVTPISRPNSSWVAPVASR